MKMTMKIMLKKMKMKMMMKKLKKAKMKIENMKNTKMNLIVGIRKIKLMMKIEKAEMKMNVKKLKNMKMKLMMENMKMENMKMMMMMKKAEKMMIDPKPSSSTASPNFGSVKRRKLHKKRNPAASKFMSVFASDDLLLEIFLRLPNGRSATQIATVCKRWHSLIIDEGFKTRFNLYHLRKQSLDSSYYPDYTNSTILYKFTPREEEGPYYEVSSKEFAPKLYDISFMPNWEDLIIRASNGYLLLLSDRTVRQYFICNSLTGLWLKLPPMPAELILFEYQHDDSMSMFMIETHGFALVCNPLDIAEDRYRYKVVIVNKCHFLSNKYHFDAAIYDSETERWTQPSFSSSSLPYDMGSEADQRVDSDDDLEIVVSSNGVLHWVDGFDGKGSVVVFDPRVDRVYVFGFPQKRCSGIFPDCNECEVRLGLVRGRVRLALMEREVKCFFSLEVWELDSNCFSWKLVHDVVLRDKSGVDLEFFLLAFDPNDENALFMVSGEKIYRYVIDQDKYKLICGFSDEFDYEELKVLTILHPLWPTPTLSLAYTNQR